MGGCTQLDLLSDWLTCRSGVVESKRGMISGELSLWDCDSDLLKLPLCSRRLPVPTQLLASALRSSSLRGYRPNTALGLGTNCSPCLRARSRVQEPSKRLTKNPSGCFPHCLFISSVRRRIIIGDLLFTNIFDGGGTYPPCREVRVH